MPATISRARIYFERVVGFETEVQGDRAVHQSLSLVLACLPDRNRAGQLLYQEFTVWRAFIKARSGTLGWWQPLQPVGHALRG